MEKTLEGIGMTTTKTRVIENGSWLQKSTICELIQNNQISKRFHPMIFKRNMIKKVLLHISIYPKV